MYELNGQIIKGDEIAVVEFMKEQVYDSARFSSLDEYIEFVAQSLFRFHGKGIAIEGNTLEARCSSLVNQLIEYEMIKTIAK